MNGSVGRRWSLAAAALAGVCGLTALPATQQQAVAETSTAAHAGTAATGGTATGYCLVPTPASWRKAIEKGALGKVPGTVTRTVAVSPGRWRRFALLGVGNTTRLVEMRAASTAYKVIASYPSGIDSGAGFQLAAADGRTVDAAALPDLPHCATTR
ncbi:hypothetical protein ABH931_002194 [Streptacidiphilus sp. MAP12-33]|uniref:hypothetical protein n=1 Tax=Streptacidiphilus sp. MAP12-33 TaxID=3156266 RepID=UPI0035182D95